MGWALSATTSYMAFSGEKNGGGLHNWWKAGSGFWFLVAAGLGCTWTISPWHCGPPWWWLCGRGSSLLRPHWQIWGGKSQASVSSLLSPACLYQGHSVSRALFQPGNQKYLSLTVCQEEFFKNHSKDKKIHSECHFGICQVSCCFMLGSAGCFMKNPVEVLLSLWQWSQSRAHSPCRREASPPQPLLSTSSEIAIFCQLWGWKNEIKENESTPSPPPLPKRNIFRERGRKCNMSLFSKRQWAHGD